MNGPCVCGHSIEEHGPRGAHCSECGCICYEEDKDYDNDRDDEEEKEP